MPIDAEQERRSMDRERTLNGRLDELEKAYRSLTDTVNKVSASIDIFKVEQGHLREMFSSSVRLLERGQELQLAEIKSLSQSIKQMADDPNNSPATRALGTEIETLKAEELQVQREVRDELNAILDRLEAKKRMLDKLTTWQERVNGVLTVLNWLGVLGVGGFILALIQIYLRAK